MDLCQVIMNPTWFCLFLRELQGCSYRRCRYCAYTQALGPSATYVDTSIKNDTL